MKFTLRCEDEEGEVDRLSGGPRASVIELSFCSSCLPDILPMMEQFLRGCGFNARGELDFQEIEA